MTGLAERGLVRVDGPRVRLRELSPADAAALHAVYGDPQVCANLSFTPRSQAECEQIIAAAARDAAADPRAVYMLAVADTSSDLLIGAARLAVEPWQAGQFGLAIRADRQQQGLGTETLRLLFRLGFGQFGLHRIWGARDPGNEASGKLMTAAGMTPDGNIRSHVRRHGIWRDSATASILEDEYQAG